MSVSSIRIDDNVKKESAAIAAELGMSLNTAINVLLKQFIRDKGFSGPLQAIPVRRYIDMDGKELEDSFRIAVEARSQDGQVGFGSVLTEDGRFVRLMTGGGDSVD